MASLFIYLASRGGGLFSTFLNYLVPKFLINALGSHPSENNFFCEIISRCSTNNFIDTWPWRMPWYGVSEITQLFSAQLGAHSPALLASWGNFFASTSFLLPPSAQTWVAAYRAEKKAWWGQIHHSSDDWCSNWSFCHHWCRFKIEFSP